MIIVMACAGRKHNAGRFALRRQFVHFVAHPETYIDFHDGVFAAPRHAFRRVAPGDEGAPVTRGGVRIHDYETERRTNWYHACARDFMAGRIGI